jgi:hypothetical protein
VYDEDDDETSRYEVDCRALSVECTLPFRMLPMGAVIELSEPLLGIPAGRWVTGAWQHAFGADSPTRSLQLAEPEYLEKYEAAGQPVLAASVAPQWRCPFPTHLEGMRLSDLRALIAEWADQPGDTLVVLAPADHPWEGRYSPASTHASTGLYLPHPDGSSYGRVYETEPKEEEDRAPHGAVPALVISPSN